MIINKWFHENDMVLNPGKCRDDKKILNEVERKTSSEEKVPGVLSDKNLSFDIHIKSMCRKANQKINALARLSNYFNNAQKFLPVNSVKKTQLR